MSNLLDAERLSLAEAARLLDVHINTMHRWRQTRGLRFLRIGTKCYVLRAELERFVAAMSDPVPEAECSEYARRAADANARAAAIGL